MFRLFLRFPSLAVAAVLVASAAHAQGNIKGCVVDPTGAVLPGVRVALTGPNEKRTAITDGQGCYEIRSLVAGSYRLLAELQAFTTVKREDIRLADGQTVTVNVTMSMTGPVEVVRFIEWCVPPGGLAGLWNVSDAVLRVRIDRNARLIGQDFAEHTATVTEVFKWPAALSQDRSTVVFRQDQWADEGTPYRVGQDLVVFLGLREGTLYRTSGWLGAFLLDGDRIQSVHPDVAPENMKVGDFITKLRALAK